MGAGASAQPQLGGLQSTTSLRRYCRLNGAGKRATKDMKWQLLSQGLLSQPVDGFGTETRLPSSRNAPLAQLRTRPLLLVLALLMQMCSRILLQPKEQPKRGPAVEGSSCMD